MTTPPRHGEPGTRLRALWWPAGALTPTETRPAHVGPEAVVLLHGLGDTADIWRPTMRQRRLGTAAVAFDLPGHGRSPWLDPGLYAVAGLADVVLQALDEAGIRHPVLVGHSLGARLGVELAARLGRPVRGAVLIDMSPVTSDAATTAIAGHLAALAAGRDSLDGLIGLMLDRLPLADPAALRCAVPAMAVRTGGTWRIPFDPAIKRLLASTGNDAPRPMLSRVAVPAAVVRGAYSAVLNAVAAAELAAALPVQPVSVHTVGMAGHAIPLEQPARLADTLAACFAVLARGNGASAAPEASG